MRSLLFFGRSAAVRRLRENRLKQAWKTRIEFADAQRVLVHGAGGARVDQTGIAQDTEMVRHARLGPAAVEFATGGGFHAREVANDLQPRGIAERMKNALQR